MRYRIDLSYDGAPFCGWQIQPGSPSVQETLEKALGTLLRGTVGVVGAGRTDTGVHALGYVAHFDFDGEVPPALLSPSGLDCDQLRYKLNAILPQAVAVHAVKPVGDDFHARFGAVRRSYSYFLHRCKDPFMEGRSYFYAYPDVDFDAMNRAVRSLVGTHDFSCFEKSGGDNKTSVCTVFSAGWLPYEPVIASAVMPGPSTVMPGLTGHPYWRFNITADRFLRNMVRAIVGTLLEVGRGKRCIEDFESLVLPVSGDFSTSLRSGRNDRLQKEAKISARSNAGESAPGHALYLTEVLYE